MSILLELPRYALVRLLQVLGGAIYAPPSELVAFVSARMQVELFRRRRRETSVSKLLVSRRADELERFQKWSDTPAAVEVREARTD